MITIKNYKMTKKERKVYNKAYREANIEKIRTDNKAWREANKDGLKAYREANKDKAKAYNKTWKKANSDKINAYVKQKKATDHMFKMACNIRSRVYNAFKKGGYKKNTKTDETLGASYQEVSDHLEAQFTEGMEWENQGEWHIDHIVPLALANTKEELIALCHYTNLQPLWAEDNLAKGDKLDWNR